MIVEMKKYRVLFVVLCIFFPMMLSAQDYFTKIRDLNMDLLLGKSPSAIKNEMESAVLLDEYSNKEGHIDYILKYKDRYNIRYIYGFDNKRLASISMTLSKNDFTTALILDAMSKTGYWHDMSESFNDVSVWRNTTFNTAIAFSTSYFDVSMEFYKDYGFRYYTKEDVERLKVQEEARRQAEMQFQKDKEYRALQERKRQDSIKRRTAINAALLESESDGVEMSDSLKKSIMRQIGTCLFEKFRSTSYDEAKVNFKYSVKISKSGGLNQYLFPVDVINGYCGNITDHKKIETFISSATSSISFPSQQVSVLDTTFVAAVRAVVSIDYVYQKRIFSVILHNGYIEFKNGTHYDIKNEFYAPYYEEIYRQLVEIGHGAGEYKLCLKRSGVDGKYSHVVEILKYKKHEDKKQNIKDLEGEKISPEFLPNSYSIRKRTFEEWIAEELNKYSIWRKYAEDIHWRQEDKKTAKVRFTISKNGEVCNVQVFNVENDALKKTIMCAFLCSPKWAPGRIGKVCIPVSYSMTIHY